MSSGAAASIRSSSALALAALLGSCGGDGKRAAGPLSPLPDRATRATLAGPLCAEAACRCREGDDDAGRPDEGAKRFEVRLGPADHEVWATVGDMLLYKSREKATDCFYLDLRPGVHRVAIRGQNESGVGFQARFAEMGGVDERTWWYDTFDFVCGAPGVCDRASLDEFTASLKGKKGKLDPCGSTKVKEVGWHSGRLPDHGLPDDLEVGLELHVYAFAPTVPPGDASCAGGPAAE